MSNNLRIALRFLTARKRSMLMSLAGIIFGVGFFIVTQAQTSGFEQFFIRTILGTNGAIRIEDKMQDTIFAMAAAGHDIGGSKFEVGADRAARKYIEGVEDPELLTKALREFRNVAGVSIVVEGSVIADSSFKNDSAKIYGIKLDDHLAVSDLAAQVLRGSGSLDDFRSSPQGIIMGKVLADRLQVVVGDSLILQAGTEQRRYRVSAIYSTGVSDIDRVRIYLHLGEARSLLKKTSGASFIQVALFDRDRAPQDAVQMEEVLRHSSKSWQEREESWLSAFKALQISAALTVSTIILISGLGMFNTLAMIVIEKTKEIAILRSMGYTRSDISRIFIWLGAIVLVIGTVGGWGLGAAVTYGVSKYPIKIRGIFSADSFQVSWNIWHYVVATVTAAVVVMTAAVIPARRAARLEPGDIIRGTSQ
ncbi:FtsX-like permease family protein [Opitutus sp. GAS368]|uniref:ABC transporter permease n=1 Tax=Opitutus sp. GAS368 TaxID=1882749 RepID=UPI00087D1A74|nr:FtsX-like permease family protein [Opitutus sp. GAS368]SDS27657.1 lipoprotein-releasing system permease protein [Opitutus sp. GAS368]